MKVTKLGQGRPLVSLTTLSSGSTTNGATEQPAPSGQVLTSTGSNAVAWASNVAIITANGSNALTGPFVNFQSGSGVSFATASNTLTISATGGGSGLPWLDVVADYGAAGDGTTDDTTAIQNALNAAETLGGAVVYFPARVYKIAGALQDTGRSNAQLLLPRREAYSVAEQITVHLLGEVPPPAT